MCAAPRERGHVTVEPLFEWDYVKFVVSTDDEGSYRVGGLVPGKYKLRGGADVGGGQRNLSRTIDLRHDADQDFIFDDNHRVRARLVFPGGTSAEMIARARQVGLAAVDDATDGEAQRTGAIDRYASAEVNGGDVTFKGRFQGAYRVQVEFYENGVGESDVKLPQPILLDNLEGDQDAGDLELPAVGWIDLSLADASAAGTLPEYGSIVLVPAGKQRTYDNATHLYLRPPKSNETIGPIAAGTYEWAANVWGFQCAPVWSTVTVRPGGSTPLQVNLRPEGVLHFVVQIGKGTVPFKRVTLSGPALEESGGTRILEPDSSTAGSRRLTTGDYRDHIGGASFTFHNLPQGDYELTVEVEGYVTWRESRSVVPGQGRREDIQLRPRVE